MFFIESLPLLKTRAPPDQKEQKQAPASRGVRKASNNYQPGCLGHFTLAQAAHFLPTGRTQTINSERIFLFVDYLADLFEHFFNLCGTQPGFKNRILHTLTNSLHGSGHFAQALGVGNIISKQVKATFHDLFCGQLFEQALLAETHTLIIR